MEDEEKRIVLQWVDTCNRNLHFSLENSMDLELSSPVTFRQWFRVVERVWGTYLRPSEKVVVWMIFDRTIGWGKERERIPLRHFVGGVIASDGSVVHPGTGLTKPTVIASLSRLSSLGAITRHGESTYGLNLEWNPNGMKSTYTTAVGGLKQPKARQLPKADTSEVQHNGNMPLSKMQRSALARYVLNNIGNRVYLARKGTKLAGSPYTDIGCTGEELLVHLEGQFTDGMHWNNYGNTTAQSDRYWNIDHIVELCRFDLSDREQFLYAVNYANLRPMWAEDNRMRSRWCSKGVKKFDSASQIPLHPEVKKFDNLKEEKGREDKEETASRSSPTSSGVENISTAEEVVAGILERDNRKVESRLIDAKSSGRVPCADRVARVWSDLVSRHHTEHVVSALTLKHKAILKGYAFRWTGGRPIYGEFVSYVEWAVSEWRFLMDNVFDWAKDAPIVPDVRFFVGMASHFEQAYAKRAEMEVMRSLPPIEAYKLRLRKAGKTDDAVRRAVEQKYGKQAALGASAGPSRASVVREAVEAQGEARKAATSANTFPTRPWAVSAR